MPIRSEPELASTDSDRSRGWHRFCARCLDMLLSVFPITPAAVFGAQLRGTRPSAARRWIGRRKAL